MPPLCFLLRLTGSSKSAIIFCMIKYALVDTCCGLFGFATRGATLVRTWLPESNDDDLLERIRAAFADAIEDDGLLPHFAANVREYFLGLRVGFKVRLDLDGRTEFQRDILRACRRIPYGCTCSYGQLAARVGRPGAARAVGQVMASNFFPLVIPCHRVIASGRRLGGFSSPSSVSQKQAMLALEGVSTATEDLGSARIWSDGVLV